MTLRASSVASVVDNNRGSIGRETFDNGATYTARPSRHERSLSFKRSKHKILRLLFCFATLLGGESNKSAAINLAYQVRCQDRRRA
jgi:hypothetical protein